MTTTRKQYSPKFKAKVAVEAIRGERTLSQLASQYHVHPVQIGQWRKTALEQMAELFVDGRGRRRGNQDAEKDALYEQIGRLKVELDWLKKKSVCSTEQLRALVEPNHLDISLRRQCELLGVSRSGLYYQPRGESAENLKLMRLIDEEYTRRPFYGSRRMMRWLHAQGYQVGRHRVRRLMELMGLEAVYPKPRLSQPGEDHKIYPYLLDGVAITRVNQVWSTDITYIRMAGGFVYLVAVMDWYSRYVLSWALSLTQELPFCLEALKAALHVSSFSLPFQSASSESQPDRQRHLQRDRCDRCHQDVSDRSPGTVRYDVRPQSVRCENHLVLFLRTVEFPGDHRIPVDAFVVGAIGIVDLRRPFLNPGLRGDLGSIGCALRRQLYVARVRTRADRRSEDAGWSEK